MPEWTPDPQVPRFVPDPELEARAQRHMKRLEEEAASPAMVRARQQWSAALAGARVALDALRDIWPEYERVIPEEARLDIDRAHCHAVDLFQFLNRCSRHFEGEIVEGVALGWITSHEELDALRVER